MKSLVAILLLIVSGAAIATDCGAIQDDDGRAYCRAMETRSKGQCVVIKDYTLRTMCTARLGAAKSGCASIRDAWQRAKCMQAGKK